MQELAGVVLSRCGQDCLLLRQLARRHIAEADDSIDWLTGYQGSFEGEAAEPNPMGEYRGKPCWVLSSRELRLPDGEEVDVRVVDASVGELYGEMAAAARDGTLWIVGGGVASQFAEEGRLDEVHVTVVPVVLGAGKPLFGRRLPSGAMRLTGTRAFGNGMVELRYRSV